MKAVIDRLEGDDAVVLVGNEEVKIDIPKELLPKGAKEGSWLKFSLELDSEGTERQKKKIEDKLKKLRDKNK